MTEIAEEICLSCGILTTVNIEPKLVNPITWITTQDQYNAWRPLTTKDDVDYEHVNGVEYPTYTEPANETNLGVFAADRGNDFEKKYQKALSKNKKSAFRQVSNLLTDAYICRDARDLLAEKARTIFELNGMSKMASTQFYEYVTSTTNGDEVDVVKRIISSM